jgi:hypothetical protein
MREQGRILSRKTWTVAGRDAVGELERWMEIGRERLGGWVSREPATALAYASGAGSAVLLMEDLNPEFALLAQWAQRPVGPVGGDGGEGLALGAAFGEGSPSPGSGGDADRFDLGALGMFSEGFEGLDGAFQAIDLGIFTDGGGGGGGDGGGA